MPHLQVTLEYREGFIKAINTILYQLVFDPLTRTLQPLTPYPPNIDHSTMTYCGEFMDSEKALQIALGNMDIQTFQLVDDYKPSLQGFQLPVVKSLGWNSKIDVSPYPSIWQPNYLSLKESLQFLKEKKEKKALNMAGKEQSIEVNIKRKRPAEPAIKVEENEVSENDLENLYSDNSKKLKRAIRPKPEIPCKKIETVESPPKQPQKHLESERDSSKNSIDEKSTKQFISDEGAAEIKTGSKIFINPFAKISTPTTKIVRSRYFVKSNTMGSGNQADIESSPVPTLSSKLDEALLSKNRSSSEVGSSTDFLVLHEKNTVTPTESVELTLALKQEEPCQKDNAEGNQDSEFASVIDSPRSLLHKPSIFDTPPSSQNKENLSKFFSMFANQSEKKFSVIDDKADLQNSDSKSSMTLSADRSIQTLKGHQVFSTPKSTSFPFAKKSLPIKTSTKCRVPGLRKMSPIDKQKQLNLREMFGYKRDAAVTNKL